MTPPALPSSTELRQYLRIETDAEMALLKDFLDEAIGTIESIIGKSLTTEQVTWYDDAQTLRLGSMVTSLFLQYVPVDPSTVVVKDVDGTVVDPSNYTVRLDQALIVGTGQGTWDGQFGFDNGPYTITCTAGYGTDPNYTTRILPALARLIKEVAAFYYQQRTPGARSESASGTRVDYEVDKETGLPVRIASALRKWRGPVFARG